MGAAASKKLSPPPHSRAISSASGRPSADPVATTTIPSAGIASTRSRRTVMSGCASIRAVTAPENASRSTASAPPAGTSQAKAAGTHTLPSRRISSLSSPAALSSRLAFRELEHTSSANPSR